MQHEIKITPRLFHRIKDGSKTFLVHDNNEGIQPGDIVILREYDYSYVNESVPTQKGFTEEPNLTFKVGYVEFYSSHSIVFSLLPVYSAEDAMKDLGKMTLKKVVAANKTKKSKAAKT